MSIRRFQNLITSASELELLYGLPSELVIRKQLRELDTLKNPIGIAFTSPAP